MMRYFIGAILTAIAIPALAGPFCAVFSYGKQCHYYNYESCAAAAGSRGACITNDEETQAPTGSGKFCVVTSYATNCFYYDAQSCRNAAASSRGVCKVKMDD